MRRAERSPSPFAYRPGRDENGPRGQSGPPGRRLRVEASRHRRLRGLGIVVLAVLVAAGGIVGGLLFLSARDRADVSSTQGPGQAFLDRGHAHLRPGEAPPPGSFASDPPTSGPHVPASIPRDDLQLSDSQILQALELGNVVLLHDGPRPRAALRALAGDVAGPFDPVLVASGGAVILGRRPRVRGVVALAWRHVLRAPDPTDPALRSFTDYWLGRGAG